MLNSSQKVIHFLFFPNLNLTPQPVTFYYRCNDYSKKGVVIGINTKTVLNTQSYFTLQQYSNIRHHFKTGCFMVKYRLCSCNKKWPFTEHCFARQSNSTFIVCLQKQEVNIGHVTALNKQRLSVASQTPQNKRF